MIITEAMVVSGNALNREILIDQLSALAARADQAQTGSEALTAPFDIRKQTLFPSGKSSGSKL